MHIFGFLITLPSPSPFLLSSAHDTLPAVVHEMIRVIRWKGKFLLQINKQWVYFVAIHFNFREHLYLWHKTVSRANILQRIQNFSIAAILLMPKLVAGKSENHKPLLTILANEVIHLMNEKQESKMKVNM